MRKELEAACIFKQPGFGHTKDLARPVTVPPDRRPRQILEASQSSMMPNLRRRHILDAAKFWTLPHSWRRHSLDAATSSKPPNPRRRQILDAAKYESLPSVIFRRRAAHVLGLATSSRKRCPSVAAKVESAS